MVSELPVQIGDESNMSTENPITRSHANKKGSGKVPKKIHKAEREKLKRDHLNELFLELGQALEPARQNNGKACILGDAARILRDLLAEVECLKKENAALVTETQYVTVEKNELIDDNLVLETQIKKLRTELDERIQIGTIHLQQSNMTSPLAEGQVSLDPALQPPLTVPPFFVFPYHQQEPNSKQDAPSMIASQVRRPHARYPTPSDSWPSQLLMSHLTEETQPQPMPSCGANPAFLETTAAGVDKPSSGK